jgi:hypothetical protein
MLPLLGLAPDLVSDHLYTLYSVLRMAFSYESESTIEAIATTRRTYGVWLSPV